MSATISPVSFVLCVVLAMPVFAQDQPKVLPPLKPTGRELDRLEALKLYGLAASFEQSNELLSALRNYEKAQRLDSDAPAIPRALARLYLALDRHEDALTASRRVLDLEPSDHETWLSYARQLHNLDRDREAIEALKRALACKSLKDQLDAHLNALFDLADLLEKAKAPTEASGVLRQALAVLERPGVVHELGGMTKELLTEQIADSYERIGRLELDAGQPDRALEAYRHAQAADATRAGRLSFHMAQVLTSQKKHAEALVAVDQYLARQPPGEEGYELKLRLLRTLRKEEQILPALEAHSRVDPHNETLRMLLAREYRQAGRLDQAESAYRRLLESGPKIEIYRGLFAVWKQQKDEGANKVLELLTTTVRAASPDDSKQPGDAGQAARGRAMLAALRDESELVKPLLNAAHKRILDGSKLPFRLRLLLALLAERSNQLPVAEQLYRSCLDNEGRVTGIARSVENEVYAGLLKALALQHKHQAIVTLCQQGLQHAEATNRVLFFEELAFAQLALDRPKEAVEAINSAVDTSNDKTRLYARCRRLVLLAEVGKMRDADTEGKAMLTEAKEESDLKAVRFALSSAYSVARQHDRSEEQLQAILKDEPTNARANNDLGYQWADRNKNLPEAERMIRKALDLDRQQRTTGDLLGLDTDRDNAAYVDSLGWVLFRRGKHDDARVQLEKASRLPDGADDPVVWDHLGDVYFRLNRRPEAVTAWKKALALYDSGHRRKSDSRYDDIRAKVKQVE